MKKKLDFEKIADCFSERFNSGSSNMSAISRCDYVIIKDDKILFIEKTNLEEKDLANPKVYAEEIIENVKKMWGSMSVFVWYVLENNMLDKIKGKDRIYLLLLEEVSGRTARFVSNMIKTLIKYRDSGFSDVKFKD